MVSGALDAMLLAGFCWRWRTSCCVSKAERIEEAAPFASGTGGILAAPMPGLAVM